MYKKSGALINMKGDAVTTKPTVRQQLRRRLTEGGMIVAPGIYDAYGARLVQQAGYEAVYMTGNGVSASLLGQRRQHPSGCPATPRRSARRRMLGSRQYP